MTYTEHVNELHKAKDSAVEAYYDAIAKGVADYELEAIETIDQRLEALDPWGRFSEENGL